MRIFKSFVVASLLIALMAGFSQVQAVNKAEMKIYKDAHEMVDDLKPHVQKVNKEQLKKMLKDKEDFYLIDIRTSKEFKAGNIKGSIHIQRGILEFKMVKKIKAKLKKDIKHDDKIVLYCKKGDRAVLSTYALMQLGYTDVSFLEGGWEKWSGKKETKKTTKKSNKRKRPSREGC